MITGGVNRVGEVGKWRQRGERDAVEKTSGWEERGRGLARENIFPSQPPIIFFLIEANSANQNAEY